MGALKSLKLINLILFIVFIAGCKNSKNGHSIDESYIEIETTSCYGPCPVYTVKYNDKSAFFEGQENVDLIGAYAASPTSEYESAYAELLNSERVSNLKTTYKSTNMLDLPTTYIRIYQNNELKTIMSYGKTHEDLVDYISFSKAMIQDLNWKKTE